MWSFKLKFHVKLDLWITDLVEEFLFGEHKSGLGVRHEDKDIRIQAKLVDPLVQVGLDINAWLMRKKYQWRSGILIMSPLKNWTHLASRWWRPPGRASCTWPSGRRCAPSRPRGVSLRRARFPTGRWSREVSGPPDWPRSECRPRPDPGQKLLRHGWCWDKTNRTRCALFLAPVRLRPAESMTLCVQFQPVGFDRQAMHWWLWIFRWRCDRRKRLSCGLAGGLPLCHRPREYTGMGIRLWYIHVVLCSLYECYIFLFTFSQFPWKYVITAKWTLKAKAL